MPPINLVPQVVDVSLYAGDGAAIRIVAALPDGGGPMALDGQLAAQVRRERPDPTALLDWHVDLTDAEAGIAVLSLSGEQTASLMEDETVETVRENGRLNLRFSGHWDVEWTPPDGEPLTLMQGAVTCALDVTRP